MERDDRSWRMGGISVLMCCLFSRLGAAEGLRAVTHPLGRRTLELRVLRWFLVGEGGLSMGGEWISCD